MKESTIFVDCAIPVKEGYIEELENKGYLLINQYDWTMVFEHPDLSRNKKETIKKHNEYMSYLISVGIVQ